MQSFRYIPPTIDPKDIQANGKLLTDAEIEDLNRVLENNPENRRYLRKDLYKLLNGKEYDPNDPHPGKRVKYSIEKINGKLYASYKSKERGIGSGGFGSVNYAMDLETGEWCVLKVIKGKKEHSEKMKADAERESEFSEDMAGKIKPRVILRDRPDKQYYQVEIIMDLAPGTTLLSACNRLPRSNETSFARKLNMIISSINAVHHAHNRKILHRDIKPENLITDEATEETRLVDYGLAVYANDLIYLNQGEKGFGTPGYMSPEVIEHGVYSSASDVYALGKSVAKVLGLVTYKKEGNSTIIELFSRDQLMKSQLENRRMLGLVLLELEKMTDPNPTKRVTLDHALQFFQEIREAHLDILIDIAPKHKRVLFLEITDKTTLEYIKNLTELGSYEEVVLTAPADHNPSALSLAKIRQALEMKKMLVKNSVLIYQPQQREAAINEFIKKGEKSDSMVYDWQLADNLELFAFQQKIINSLKGQAQRLQNKYGSESSKTCTLIHHYIDKISKMGLKPDQLLSDLKELQKKILDDFFKTHRIQVFLNKHFGYQPKTQLLHTVRSFISESNKQQKPSNDSIQPTPRSFRRTS